MEKPDEEGIKSSEDHPAGAPIDGGAPFGKGRLMGPPFEADAQTAALNCVPTLTRRDLMTLLNKKSLRDIDRMVERGQLPEGVKLGGERRWWPGQVEQHIRERQQKEQAARNEKINKKNGERRKKRRSAKATPMPKQENHPVEAGPMTVPAPVEGERLAVAEESANARRTTAAERRKKEAEARKLALLIDEAIESGEPLF